MGTCTDNSLGNAFIINSVASRGLIYKPSIKFKIGEIVYLISNFTNTMNMIVANIVS